MRPCPHPPLEGFDVRGVARLCDGCLLRLHELDVGVPDASWFTGVPNRFVTPLCRAVCVAKILGVVEPYAEEALALVAAATLVVWCDDCRLGVGEIVDRWLLAGTTSSSDLDRTLEPFRHRVVDLLSAVDRVVEIADA